MPLRLRFISGSGTVESIRMPPLPAEALLLHRTDGPHRRHRFDRRDRGHRTCRSNRNYRCNRSNRPDGGNCPVNICTTRKMP